jgi:hypothetical protein
MNIKLGALRLWIVIAVLWTTATIWTDWSSLSMSFRCATTTVTMTDEWDKYRSNLPQAGIFKKLQTS